MRHHQVSRSTLKKFAKVVCGKGDTGLAWLAIGRSSETTNIGMRIHLNVKIGNHVDLHHSMSEAQDMFRKYDDDGTYDTVVISP
jgi:hypothetical protein